MVIARSSPSSIASIEREGCKQTPCHGEVEPWTTMGGLVNRLILLDYSIVENTALPVRNIYHGGALSPHRSYVSCNP